MSKNIYDFWSFISAASIIIGLFAAIFGFVVPDIGGKLSLKVKILLRVLAILFVVFAIFVWRYHEVNTCVPSIMGMSIDNARQTLRQNNLELELEEGQEYSLEKEIKYQYPDADEIVKKGSTVICGFEINRFVIVPDVTNMTQLDAARMLQISGLKYKVYSDGLTTGELYVIEQDLSAGSEARAGSTVSIRLSSEKPDTVKQMPEEFRRNAPKRDYFIVFDDDANKPTQISTITGESTEPEPAQLCDEDLVHVVINSSNIDITNVPIIISTEGISTGVVQSMDNGCISFYITPGEYLVKANLGNTSMKTKLIVKDSGNYSLVF